MQLLIRLDCIKSIWVIIRLKTVAHSELEEQPELNRNAKNKIYSRITEELPDLKNTNCTSKGA